MLYPEALRKTLEERSGSSIPRAVASLEDVFISRDRRIWAPVASPLERAKNADGTRRDSPASPGSYQSATVWEVYSSAGVFLGRIQFPDGAQLVQADGDRVWIIDHDENDLPAVTRLRVSPSLGR